MCKKYNIAIVLWVFILALPAVAGLTASNPSPAPGQIITDVNTNLTWTAGTQAASHNVYFGTDFDNVNNTRLVGNLANGQWIDFADVKILADHWLTESNFPGLVSHWALDGDANDSIGGNDGTVQGDPQWINGIVAGALDLDGDDYIDCGSDSSLDLTNNFTIALWVKMDSGSSILCKGTMNPTATGGAYSISSDGSSNCIFILRNNTDSAPTLVFAPMNFGQWTHIAVTFSNGNMAVYVDGSQMNTGTLSTATVNTNTEPLAIGAEADGDGAVVGSIDDVHIYNNVLSAGDILTIANLPGHGDFNGDGRINLVDYSIQADNWKKRRDAKVLMGNQDANSFDPGVLDGNETTYYWRIDEVNGPDVFKGDVWNFVVADKWQISEFMIMLGWPYSVEHPNPATIIQAMAADSFNTVMWDVGKLEMARQNDMKLMVMPSNPAIAAQLAFDSAVWGYHVSDEPSAPYTGIPETVAALHQADPTHPAMVNLSGGIYNHPDFIDLVNPEILSYTGSYQWRPGRNTATHWLFLEEYRAAAKAENLPLVFWVDVIFEGDYDSGSAAKMRQSVFTSLPYGTKGIQWFVAWDMYELGTTNYKLSGSAVAAINADVKKLGPHLIGLESVDVFHTRPTPIISREIKPGYWLQVSGGQIVLGLLKDNANSDYAMIANRDVYSSATATLEFLTPVLQVKHFNKSTGQWILLTIDNSGAHQRVQVPLAKGDGELLSINRVPSKAGNLNPADGLINADPNSDLNWDPGYAALSHDIYFGTSLSAVSDANTNDATGIYRGSQTAGNDQYELATLDANTTYHWRIDAVNGIDILKGNLWTFTTVDSIAEPGHVNPDDFDRYMITDDWQPTQQLQGWSLYRGMTGPIFSHAQIKPGYSHDGSQCLRYVGGDAGNPDGYWYADVPAAGIVTISMDVKLEALAAPYGQARLYPYWGSQGSGEQWLEFGRNDYGSYVSMEIVTRDSSMTILTEELPGRPTDPNDYIDKWYTFEIEFNYTNTTIRARFAPTGGAFNPWTNPLTMRHTGAVTPVYFAALNGVILIDNINFD